MPTLRKTVSIDKFNGLNNTDRPQRTDPAYLKTALNIDIDATGGISKRNGFVQRSVGDWHSLWSDGNVCYGVMDLELVEIRANFTIRHTGIVAGTEKVSFDSDGLYVYFSSSVVNGIIDQNGVIRPWGLERPNPLPTISIGTGLLPAGEYQVALTCVDAFGRESGASVGQSISLSAVGSIVLSGMPVPTDPSIVGINVYATAQSGSQLKLLRSIPVGVPTVVINDVFGIVTLKTIGVYPAQKGHLVRYVHSRLWVAEDNFIWFSDSLVYDWFRPSISFFSFDKKVRAIMPVSNGVWVAAERLYYLAGRDATTMVRSDREETLIVDGTEVPISGSFLALDNTPPGIRWLVAADLGIFALFDNGVSINTTVRNVELPKADKGSGMFVTKDGIDRYMSILQKKAAGNAVIGDQITGTIIRNGVKVNE